MLEITNYMISQRKKRRLIQLSGTQKNIWHKDFLFPHTLSLGLLPNISTQQEAVAHVSVQPSAFDRIQKAPHFLLSPRVSEACSLHNYGEYISCSPR